MAHRVWRQQDIDEFESEFEDGKVTSYEMAERCIETAKSLLNTRFSDKIMEYYNLALDYAKSKFDDNQKHKDLFFKILKRRVSYAKNMWDPEAESYALELLRALWQQIFSGTLSDIEIKQHGELIRTYKRFVTDEGLETFDRETKDIQIWNRSLVKGNVKGERSQDELRDEADSVR